MTTQTQEFEVILVGGGMVGAAAALGFARNGFKVALLEKQVPNLSWGENEPYQVRVSALTRASENLLKNLGAWPNIEKRRLHPFESMRIWEEAGTSEINLDAQSLNEPNLGYIIENNVTQAALWEALQTYENVKIFTGITIQKLSFESYQAKLNTDQGDFSAQLLIGADGAFSQIRQLAGIGLDQHDYGQAAVVGCVKTQVHHQNACWQRYRPEGPFAYLAMEGNVSSIAWYLPVEKLQWALSLSDEEYKQEIFKASDGRLGKVEEVWARGGFPLTRRHAQHYVKPNLALIGDAAHTIHPQAGQGVNLGFLDAATLVEVVAEAKKNGEYIGDIKVLRRFERWRRGDNALVQRSMEGFDWLYQQDSKLKTGLRSRLLPLANIVKPVKNLLIEQALYGRKPQPKLTLSPV